MYAMTRNCNAPARRAYASSFPFMDDFFRPFAEMAMPSLRSGVRETDEAYFLDAELPGFEQADIEMSVKGGMLTIDAEHKEEEGKENENKYAFSARSFHRSYSLDGIDDGAISAEYKNGVLTVKLPKVHPAEPETRKIEIH